MIPPNPPALVLLLLLVLCALNLANSITRITAFSTSTRQRHRTASASNRVGPSFMTEDLFADIAVTVRTSDFHSSAAGDVLVDKNGKEISVACVVRVCVDGLKAYQINAKGQGMFDEKKIFVPDVSDSKKKCLALPMGLRGTVTKVYDENVVSANLPIQVKFTPGMNTEEGFDVPTALLMHFTAEEVECV